VLHLWLAHPHRSAFISEAGRSSAHRDPYKNNIVCTYTQEHSQTIIFYKDTGAQETRQAFPMLALLCCLALSMPLVKYCCIAARALDKPKTVPFTPGSLLETIISGNANRTLLLQMWWSTKRPGPVQRVRCSAEAQPCMHPVALMGDSNPNSHTIINNSLFT
jgi:hypothetical protein